MEIFYHHIYEYLKGIRNLILHTTVKADIPLMVKKLNSEGISYLIMPVDSEKINIFFGDVECIEVIKSIGKNNLGEYTPEEDFMLGIMLGYDRRKQCLRFLDFKNKIKIKIS